MASIGHLAVGMMACRLQSGGRKVGPAPDCARAASARVMLAFALLGLLPDADLLVVALGASDNAAIGHRGGSHSLMTAVVIGLDGSVLAARLGWSAVRTALAM